MLLTMKTILNFLLFALLLPSIALAQTPINIPPIVSGQNIDLTLQNGTTEFYTGFNTTTNGYNGSYLGPTILLQKGQNVTLNVTNNLGDTTTTHWHGLHVAPINDGSPHNLILNGATWSPSFTVMDNAATYWYHPHLHGKTMSQVLKGAAGLIIVQDTTENALTLPRTYGVDDIPLVFQFLTINNATKQIAINDELDNTVLVNGSLTTNALLNVPAQMVRFRLLNASSHRFFDFGFNDNRTFSQITSDDGLLNAPVSLTKLVLAPGERAEILVDFANQQGSTFYLKQYGTQLPSNYPGGPQGMMGMALGPLDNTNFNLLQINVVAPTANPITTLPNTLTNNIVWSQVGASTRNIAITASPMMSMTNFLMNGVKYNHDLINFTTQQENVEIWNITNQSMMPHPFHIHGNHFYILDINGVTPPANMQGRKDVVTIPPMNGTVRIITKYQDFSDSTMPYMYHCHILSHEDTGMMGQFIVNGAANGTNEISENNALFIYPNPINSNTDVLTVQSENNINNIAIFDVLGRQISTQKINGKQITLAVPIANGFYIVQVKTDQTTLSQKIVVTH